MIKFKIDGKEITAAEGQSILDASLKAGIYIPHLCHHPDLEPLGACNLCGVKIEGRDGVFPSCDTPAEEGMSVHTDTEELRSIRRISMQLMLTEHPSDCSTCPRYGNCPMQSIIQYLGISSASLRSVSQRITEDSGNPLFVRDMTRCIKCGRCVRACRELRGINAIDYTVNAHGNVEIKNTLAQQPGDMCRFCCTCVEVCPTGALREKETEFSKRARTREERLVPCRSECPAHIDIPAYIRAVREGRPGDAVGIIREKVPFPLVLGHICNHLCEGVCKRGDVNSPMGIRNLKRYAVSADSEKAWKGKGFMRERSGKRVAVVGSGPCGLTAAYYLNKCGHSVSVFEKRPQLGGPMTSGIPAYRLPLEDVMEEINYIIESGVEAKVNSEISNVAALKADYDAVLLAVGVSQGKRLPIPGADLPQVFTAMDVLADCRVGADLSALGDTVCVIGSGSVGYDAARSLIRRGKKVSIVCLEQANALLADEDDVSEGEQEGVVLCPGRAFEAIEAENGRVSGLRVHTVLSSTYDKATGQVTEEAVPDSQEVLPCDSVVFAVGQHTGLNAYPELGIEINSRAYPVTEGMRTSLDGVFAAGDAITGISFVIKAIAQGRDAASEIDRYLGGDGCIDETLVEREYEPHVGECPDFAYLTRVEQELLPAQQRISCDDNVYRTYSCQEAACEAGRCLQCDLRAAIKPERKWSDYSNNGGNN